MANFKVQPIEVIAAPNFYAPLVDNRWEITNPNAQTLWFQLQISDSLGTRRYMLASGGTLEVTFQRSDLIAAGGLTGFPSQITNTARSVIKTAVPHANDRSLFSIAMTTQDIQGIVTGSTKYKMVESGVETVWLFDWSVRKKLTNPGF